MQPLAFATTSALGGFGPLVEAMPDGIVIADRGGRILYVNQLAEELSGYQREELVGLTVETLVPERFREVHLDHRAGYASSPRARPMGSGVILHLLRKDGIEHPVDIALSPIDTEVGGIVVTAIRIAISQPVAAGRTVERLQAIADVIAFLVSDAAASVSGASVTLTRPRESPGSGDDLLPGWRQAWGRRNVGTAARERAPRPQGDTVTSPDSGAGTARNFSSQPRCTVWLSGPPCNSGSMDAVRGKTVFETAKTRMTAIWLRMDLILSFPHFEQCSFAYRKLEQLINLCWKGS